MFFLHILFNIFNDCENFISACTHVLTDVMDKLINMDLLTCQITNGKFKEGHSQARVLLYFIKLTKLRSRKHK